MQGEMARAKVMLRPPSKGRQHHLYCSPHNAGAAMLAEELAASGIIQKGELKWTEQADELEGARAMLAASPPQMRMANELERGRWPRFGVRSGRANELSRLRAHSAAEDPEGSGGAGSVRERSLTALHAYLCN